MNIPHSGEVTFRVKTGLFDFHLQLSEIHQRLSLYRQFPTDSGQWRLEEYTRLDSGDLPFRAVIQIDGFHKSSKPAVNPLESILGRWRKPQGDRPYPALIRFEIRSEVNYSDWFHAQPGADTPWLVGTAKYGASQLQDYFESVLAALEACYPGLIEFDTPVASPEMPAATSASEAVDELSPVSSDASLAEGETSHPETERQDALSTDLQVETQAARPSLSIDDEPWLMIPDIGYDRDMVRLWWEGYTGPEIGARVNKAPKTIYNRLWVLRGRHGTAIVPTDDRRRALRLK